MIRTRENISSTIALLGLLCTLVVLQCDQQAPGEKPPGLIKPLDEYTQETAREWQDVAPEHEIFLRDSRARGKVTLLAELKNFNGSLGHYIESMGIYDEDKEILKSYKFPRSNQPITHAHFIKDELPQGVDLKVYARCNQHDIWVKPVVIE